TCPPGFGFGLPRPESLKTPSHPTTRTGPAMRVAIIVSLVFLASGLSCESARGDERIDFQKQIQPILQKNCSSCHGAAKQKAGLRLETGGQVMKGSVEGAIVAPTKPN